MSQTLTKQSSFRDNTQLSCYRECPRRFQLRHVLGWRGVGTALPLSFGLSWHAAMDAVWKYTGHGDKEDVLAAAMDEFILTWESEGLSSHMTLEDIEQLSPRTPMVAAEMLSRYYDQRYNVISNSKIVAVESPFAVPLPGVNDTWYVGRLDKCIDYNGQRLVIEHKTTTAYKKDGGFQSSYIDSWAVDSQVKGYQYSGQLYYGASQVWVDSALVHKTVHDAFRFVPVSHSAPLLQEWITYTVEWISRIDRDIERNYFPKNETSCMGKYGPCSFLDICRTCSDPLQLDGPPAGYIEEFWLPFDVLELNKLIQGE